AERSLMESTKTLEQTQALLRELTGISDIDFLTDIYQLFFYNEERNYTLGSRFRGIPGHIYRSRVLMALCGHEAVNQTLTKLEENLKDVKSQLRAIRTKSSSLRSLIPEEEQAVASSKALSNLRKQLPTLEDKRAQLNNELGNLMSKKQPKKNEQDNIRKLMKERDSLVQSSAQLQYELDNLNRLIKITQEAQEWMCPVCQHSVSPAIISERVKDSYCPLCGTGHPEISPIALSNLKSRIEELEKQIIEKNQKITQISTSNIDPEITERIGTITSQLSQVEAEIASTQKQIFESSNQLTENQGVAIQIQEELDNMEEQASKLILDVETFERSSEFLLHQVATFTKEFYQQLTKRFGQLQTSMFGKILSQINEDFTLDNAGRERFEDFSKTEKKTLELLFRLAATETAVNMKIFPEGFLIIETPTQDLDATYKEALALLFNGYLNTSIPIRLVITTLDMDFLKACVREESGVNILMLPEITTTATPRQIRKLESYFQNLL
ncbi:MAG: hypothetical protein ACFFBD_24125, partial [Candidatus Hodarchaeota archaeon]